MLKKIAIACGIIGAGVIGYQIGKHLGDDAVEETDDADTELDEGDDETPFKGIEIIPTYMDF